jgi:beta-phosphoglucomutase-like phosphatase (HAD superfamily)
MTRHRAAIFDMDGVLIESEPFWREAEIEVFRGVGVSLTEADCALMMGRRTDEVVDHWNARRPSQRRPKRTLDGPPDNRRRDASTRQRNSSDRRGLVSADHVTEQFSEGECRVVFVERTNDLGADGQPPGSSADRCDHGG